MFDLNDVAFKEIATEVSALSQQIDQGFFHEQYSPTRPWLSALPPPTSDCCCTQDGATSGCSGEIDVQYRAVSCSHVGLASGGLKVGLMNNQCDPWCPPFWFSNVGGEACAICSCPIIKSIINS